MVEAHAVAAASAFFILLGFMVVFIVFYERRK